MHAPPMRRTSVVGAEQASKESLLTSGEGSRGDWMDGAATCGEACWLRARWVSQPRLVKVVVLSRSIDPAHILRVAKAERVLAAAINFLVQCAPLCRASRRRRLVAYAASRAGMTLFLNLIYYDGESR